MKSFEHFYDQRHSGRKLTWRAELGNVDVKVQFRNRKHELNVSTQAIIVLYLFETLTPDEHLSFSVRPLSKLGMV
jgi:cullin 3